MNKLKSFKDIAQENAMHLLKKELAKEAKKAAINPSDAEEASEEKTMYCKDCGCEKGKPDPDCTCENDCNNLTAAQCTTEKSKCKSLKKEAVNEYGGPHISRKDYLKPMPYKGEKVSVKNELTIADVQNATAMAKKRQDKERKAGKKSVSTTDLAARMPKKEAQDPKHVKQAVGIASDPRYKGGNMTGATKVINKLSKGLSDHPQVKAVLKRQNEDVNEISQATKDRYVARASGAAQVGAVQSKYMKGDAKDKNDKMVAKRQAGIKKAVGEEMTMPMGKVSKLPTYTNNKQNDDKKAEIRNDLKALRGRLAKLSRTKQEAHLDYNPAKGGYNQPKDKEVGKRVGTREDKQVKSADKRPVNVNVDGKIVTRMEPVVKRKADKEVSELSNHKMSQYRTKAYDDAGAKWAAGDTDKAKARVKGVSKATDKMDKNRVSELSNHTIDSYKKKAKVSINKAADTYDYKTAMKRTRGFGHVLNKAKKSGTNEDYKITKIYNPTTRKSRAAGTSTATYAVHTHDRKYFKEFPNQKDAEKHMKSMDKKK